jgi:hypothetical protein
VIRSVPLMILACACSPVKKETAIDWSQQYCESKIEMTFPDGAWAEYDGCKELTVDAHYEFDPDDPPEVLDYKIQFSGVADTDMECWLILTSHGVCGPGYYGIGESESVSIQLSTYDCPFVPDAFEQDFLADNGTLLLENVSAGTQKGDFTNQHLLTEIQGSLDATTPEGVELIVSWSTGVFIKGEDGEESDCALNE